MRNLSFCLLALAACSTPACAAFTVGTGSSVDFADAVVGLGCSDLTIAGSASATTANISGIANLNLSGTFIAGGAGVTLGGNFSDAGTFAGGTSTLDVVDTCGGAASAFSGSIGFYDLSITSATGKSIVFPVGANTGVTHFLTLRGTAGALLNIVSSAPGTQALLAVAAGAGQSIAYVDARDNKANAATIAPGPATAYHSVDGGDLSNWFAAGANGGGPATPAVAAPALGGGFWLLLLALSFSGFAAARRRTQR